jgi:hypothetical protein
MANAPPSRSYRLASVISCLLDGSWMRPTRFIGGSDRWEDSTRCPLLRRTARLGFHLAGWISPFSCGAFRHRGTPQRPCSPRAVTHSGDIPEHWRRRRSYLPKTLNKFSQSWKVVRNSATPHHSSASPTASDKRATRKWSGSPVQLAVTCTIRSRDRASYRPVPHSAPASLANAGGVLDHLAPRPAMTAR